jgi:parallel beta-helix repeat protein
MKSPTLKLPVAGRFLVLTCASLLWMRIGGAIPRAMASQSRPASYYVDVKTGNDAYSGRYSAPTAGLTDGPFKTIQKAYDKLKAGDSLLIRRGTYRETVTLYDKGASAGSPIVISAFAGDEGAAIISAADEIRGWRPCPDAASCAGNSNWEHIAYVDVNSEVKQLFQNGSRLRRSRYPDTGWLFLTAVDPNRRTTVFFGPKLTPADSCFNGSVCNIKTELWCLDQVPVSACSGQDGKVSLAAPTTFDITLKCGYYFTNLVHEINEEGEWAYDPVQKRVYLWPLGASLDNIESSVRAYGIEMQTGCSYHTIKGLAIRGAVNDAIRMYKTDHVTIQANQIDYSYSAAIEEYDGANASIIGNTINCANERGITDHNLSTGHLITGNAIYATGAQNFADDPIKGAGQGIFICGSHARVINNRVDRSGYNGIYLSGATSGREVAYNYVTNSCLSLSDGAGIYTAGYSSAIDGDYFHHNIVADIWGYLGGSAKYGEAVAKSPSLGRGEAYGIYLDEQGNNRVFEHNTVFNGGSAGIFFHWTQDNQLIGNTVYGNTDCQVLLSGKDDPRFILQDNAMRGNLLIATTSGQATLKLSMDYNDVRFGDSDGNYFYHPQGDKHIAVYKDLGEIVYSTYSIAEWRHLSGEDTHSTDLSLSNIAMHSGQPTILGNPSMQTAYFDLGTQQYSGVDGKLVSGKISLGAFESIVLFPRTTTGQNVKK